jgi:hypothetical protein
VHARLKRFGKIGLALLLLNEIRGAVTVAMLLTSAAHAEPGPLARLAERHFPAACAVAPVLCGGSGEGRR